jgi:drug/metabolite transporter (DMT)-like permease
MALVMFGSVIGSFGAVFLKAGASKLKDGFWRILNIQLALGVTLFLLSSVFFISGIRHGELSVLYPMVALGYVWTMFWSRLFFQEEFTRQKVVGLVLILLGVFFVGVGSK